MSANQIIECNKCFGLLIATKNQKTKICTYCNTRLIINKLKKVGYAKNAFEASIIIKNLKQKKGFKRKFN
jgi:hypothetical protein